MNNKQFKKDFGVHLVEQGVDLDNLIISDNFKPINLVFFPDKTSSITAEINGMLASFDFDDSILKIFIRLFIQENLITMDEIEQILYKQTVDPVSLDLHNSRYIINNLVMVCSIKQADKSQMTSETFFPIIIKDIKIV